MAELDPSTQPRGDAQLHVSPEATTQISPAMPAERATQFAGVPRIDGYRVERLLGQGGMGAVYLAEEIALGRLVAIKFIARRDDDMTNRFAREARLLATVEHPNVVRIYSLGSTERAAFIVMEYVEGETLAHRIARRGALPISEAIRITRQVVSALSAAAAKQIVHRDVKPSNILLDRAGNVHVADFGLAKPTAGSADPITHSGTVVGTPHYLSPEQAEGEEVGLRSDIYSLGVVLFEMLTGRRPFEASTPVAVIAKHLHEPFPSVAKLRRGVPRELSSLVDRMTRKSPAERPRSYDEIRPTLDVAARSRNKRVSLTSVFAALGVVTFLYGVFSFSQGVWFGAKEQQQEARQTTARATKPRTYDGEPISLQLKDVDLPQVLGTFGKITDLNFAVDADVPKQRVTVDFHNVPWDAAFETILRQNRLTYSVDGNIVRVGRIARFVEEAEQMARLGLQANMGGRFPEPASATGSQPPPQPAPPVAAAGAIPSPVPAQAPQQRVARVAGTSTILAPELLVPADDFAVDRDALVELKWSIQPKASAYQLQVSRSRLFPGLQINSRRETTSARARVLKGGRFFWRVASVDASGRIGPFSDYRTFLVKEPAAQAPTPRI